MQRGAFSLVNSNIPPKVIATDWGTRQHVNEIPKNDD